MGLAEIESPGDNTRGFSVIRAVPLLMIDGQQSICTVCSAYINFEGGFGKN
jgi:hypothetical protein